MGACYCLQDNHSSSLSDDLDHQAVQANNEISGHMNVAAEIDNQTRKLLLLGGGSSGKSTLLKQMRYLYIYKRGYPADDLRKYRDIVIENVLHILITLATNCLKLGYENEKQNEESIAMLLSTDVKSALLGFDSNNDLKQCLLTVWSDKGIKKTFDNRHKFVLMDNALYLLECMSRIMTNEYMPTFTDVLYTRSVTTGITKEIFIYETIKGTKQRYELVDVGGQRTERRKWIQCFDDVLGILFCIALSGYDQSLWEDNTVNRFEEALNLLHSMCNEDKYKPLRNAKFIIFLNKRDLFREKIGKVPFQYQKEFGPSNDYDEIIEWIKNKIIKFDLNRTFYFNVTCATDTEDVDRVFQICHDIIIRNAIGRGGFI
eukprot:761461_1